MPLSPEVQAILQRLGLPQGIPQPSGGIPIPPPRIPGAPNRIPGVGGTGLPGGAAPSSRLLPQGGIGGAAGASRVAPRAPQAGRSSALAAGQQPGGRGIGGLPQIPGTAPRTPVGVSPLGPPPTSGPPNSAPILSNPYAGAALGTAPRQPVGIGPLTGGPAANSRAPITSASLGRNLTRPDVSAPIPSPLLSQGTSTNRGLDFERKGGNIRPGAGNAGQPKLAGGVDEAMADAVMASAIADNPERNDLAFLKGMNTAVKDKNKTGPNINAAAKAATVGVSTKAKDAPAWSLPLIRMGLTMAASRNPQFGAAFAEGGLAGLNTYVSERDKKKSAAAAGGIAAEKARVARANAGSQRIIAEAQERTSKRAPKGKPGQIDDLVRRGLTPEEAIRRVYPQTTNRAAEAILKTYTDAKIFDPNLTLGDVIDNYGDIVQGLEKRKATTK